MAITVAGLFLVVVIFCVLGLISLYRVDIAESRIKVVFWKTLTVVLFGLAFGTILTPYFYEFPKFDYDVVTFEDGNLVKHPYGTSNSKAFNIPKSESIGITIVGNVTGVTTNPKVRNVSYRLEMKIVSPEVFFIPEYRRKYFSTGHSDEHPNKSLMSSYTSMSTEYLQSSVQNELGTMMASHMYEFNNAHSKELAEFYNPIEQTQQDQFRELVEPWMNSRFESKGVKVIFRGFSISYPQ